MNFIQKRITEIERDLKAFGKTPTELCRLAGVAPSNWGRWREAETAPNTRTWGRIDAAFEKVKAKARKARSADAA